jgi:hypothetical protein
MRSLGFISLPFYSNWDPVTEGQIAEAFLFGISISMKLSYDRSFGEPPGRGQSHPGEPPRVRCASRLLFGSGSNNRAY